jgi:hypothetical protein
MTYTVVWTPTAESELARMWSTATNRLPITNAANTPDAALARDPYSVGESRGGPTRIAFESPLAVLFDVDDDGRTVRVWDLWHWRG